MKIAQIDELRPGKKSQFLLDHRFPDLLELVRADTLGTHPPRLDMLDEWQKSRDELIAQKEKYIIKSQKLRLFSGDDLIKLGLSPSKKFKEILDKVHDRVLENEIATKQEAINYAKTLI